MPEVTPERLCTCHPDDRPPVCQKRYAASECQAAYRLLNCLKHGPHDPGECPQCDELAEGRMIVSTTHIPPAPSSKNRRQVPTFEGRLYAQDGSHAGNWVRRAEVDVLLDEIAALQSLWDDMQQGFVEVFGEPVRDAIELLGAVERIRSGHETKPQPVAWRHLVDSPYERHPRWHYTEEAPTEEPERFEALYVCKAENGTVSHE